MKDNIQIALLIIVVSANTIMITNRMGLSGALYLITMAMGIYTVMRYLIRPTTHIHIDEKLAKMIAIWYFNLRRKEANAQKKEEQK